MIKIEVRCDRCNTLFNPKVRAVGNGDVSATIDGFVSHPQYTKTHERGGLYFVKYDLCHTCKDGFDASQKELHDTYFEGMLAKPGREG